MLKHGEQPHLHTLPGCLEFAEWLARSRRYKYWKSDLDDILQDARVGAIVAYNTMKTKKLHPFQMIVYANKIISGEMIQGYKARCSMIRAPKGVKDSFVFFDMMRSLVVECNEDDEAVGEMELQLPDPNPNCELQMMLDEDAAVIEDAYNSLTESERKVVWLCICEGMVYGRAAKVLGLNYDQAKTTHDRAVAKLKAAMRRHSFAP